MDSRALSLPEPVIHSTVVCWQGAETTRHMSCVITPSSAEPPGWRACVLLCWGCQTPVPPTPTSALFVVLDPWNQWFGAKARSGAAGGPRVGALCGGPGGRRGWARMGHWWVLSQGRRASSPRWDHLDLGLDEGQIWDPTTNATKHERQGGRATPRPVPRRTGTRPARQGPLCLSESRGVCSPSDPQIT